jgi:Ca2+-binding EF-hand superfamily protein
MDADFDGTVDLKQLRRFVKQGLKLDIDRVRLKGAFDHWDQNGNGSIEINELEQAMRRLRRSQATGTVFTSLLDDRAFSNVAQPEEGCHDPSLISNASEDPPVSSTKDEESAFIDAPCRTSDCGVSDTGPGGFPDSRGLTSAGSMTSEQSNISLDYFCAGEGVLRDSFPNVMMQSHVGPPRCYEPPRIVLDRRKRHVKHAQSKKQLSNALLLHFDKICKLRGFSSLVELFRNELHIDEGGTVDLDQLTFFFGKIGVQISDDLVREIFSEWDSKESQSIDIAEIGQAMQLARRLQATGTAMSHLDDFDITAAPTTTTARNQAATRPTSSKAAAKFMKTRSALPNRIVRASRPSTASHTPQFVPPSYDSEQLRPQSAASIRSSTASLPPAFNGIAKARLKLMHRK